jgi:RNA polymerase sigma-70 factor (ECF subfamily)
MDEEHQQVEDVGQAGKPDRSPCEAEKPDLDKELRQFESLMERVRAGDEEAAREVYERYSEPVRRVVRRWLEHRLRRQYDSADFVQSVWASFFQIPAEGYLFPNPRSLVAFLSRLAYNKVIDTMRSKDTTARRAVREQSLDAPATAADSVSLGQALPASTHTPSQYVAADERWQRLLRDLAPKERRVLELLREGHSQVEIADNLDMDRKAIQRLLDRLREVAVKS